MKKRVLVRLISVLTISVLGIAGCSSEESVSSANKKKLESVQLPNEKDKGIDLEVYFDASNDDKKVEVKKEEVLINKEELLGELIINQLIKGPSIESKLKAILPKETRLISFSIKDSIAIVNLSKEVSVKMTPAKEEACLRGFVLSLSQLESVKKVKILVENKSIDTLGGNYDISNPFSETDIASMRKK